MTMSYWQAGAILFGVAFFFYFIGLFKGKKAERQDRLLEFQSQQEAMIFEQYLNTLKGGKNE